jgi:hypothetical protein
MTEREKLILHLQNLLKSNTKSATLDVEYLLKILDALPSTVRNTLTTKLDNVVNVDGGSFYDELNS